MEIAIIVGLSGLCIWFAWRLFTLRRGIEELTGALTQDPPPPLRDVADVATQQRLLTLSTAALDTVTEATLLRDSERNRRNFLEALLNEIKDAIFILDANREIRFLNEAARQLFPSDQAYLERAFLEVCRDHRIYDTLDLAEELGSKVSDKIVLRTQELERDRIKEINLLVEAEPLTFEGAGASGSGSWILLRNITSQLETEQIRRDFVANASHELRTPLSIINGYLETMDDADMNLNQAMFRRAVRTMRKHGKRISRIVEDMLTISKLENASNLLNFEPFDLRDSLDEIISQLMPLIEEYHAKVKVSADSDEALVLEGDRYYWDQIFFNLIENALKQNRSKGLRIEIKLSSEGGRYIIEIKDNGIGIPAADIPLIFKRFYRIQKHHAQNEVKGTGLGLSIAKRAVEAHSGTISVDSQPGFETVFTISVPHSSLLLASRTAST